MLKSLLLDLSLKSNFSYKPLISLLADLNFIIHYEIVHSLMLMKHYHRIDQMYHCLEYNAMIHGMFCSAEQYSLYSIEPVCM